MDKKVGLRVLSFAVAIALSACAEAPNKIGSTVKGERIAVIEEAKALTADKDLKEAKPTLPRMALNKSWPQPGYDGQHALPYVELATKPKIVWSHNIGEGSDSDFKLLSRPVLDKQAIYTMDARGLVTAFDADSGKRLWKLDTAPADKDYQAIGGGLAVDGGQLFATTGFGDILAVDAANGKVNWRKSLQKPLRSAPVVSDNRVYALTLDNELYSLAARDGSVIWKHASIAENATLMGASSPAAEGDNVIVAYNSGEIFALRAQNGRVLWNYSLSSAAQVGALPAIADIRGLPVIDKNRIYAVSHSGRMATIDQRSGDRVWEQDIGGIDTPVVIGDTVFVYGGDSQLMALSRDSGLIMWATSLPRSEDPNDRDSDPVIWSGPVLAGERLWMVNSLGKLVSFMPADGAPADTIKIGEPLFIAPVVVDRMMYLIGDEGTLFALK